MSRPSTSHAILKPFLEKYPSTRFIRYVIHDYHNVPRCVLTSTRRALALNGGSSEIGGVSSNSALAYCMTNTGHLEIELWIPPGMCDFVPVWETLKPTIRDDEGMVICRIKEYSEPEACWYERDPRSVLQRNVDEGRKLGIGFKVGFEIEFLLLDSAEATEPMKAPPGINFDAALVRHPSFELVREAVRMLEDAGVGVWKFEGEADKGSYEVVLEHQDPTTAVDNLVYAYDVIKSVASKHDLHATMHPARFGEGTELGQHIHISLDNDDLSVSFLDGLLSYFRAISAILLGGIDSYGCRELYFGMGDIFWSRGKLAPIRRVSTSHFEIRVPDALSNPYLQVASIIGAGLTGVRGALRLEMKEDKRVDFSPMDEELKARLGVTERIPGSLTEAVDAMDKDRVFLKGALGEMCYEALLGQRKRHVKEGEKTTREDRGQAIVQHI